MGEFRISATVTMDSVRISNDLLLTLAVAFSNKITFYFIADVGVEHLVLHTNITPKPDTQQWPIDVALQLSESFEDELEAEIPLETDIDEIQLTVFTPTRVLGSVTLPGGPFNEARFDSATNARTRLPKDMHDWNPEINDNQSGNS